jgi:hypothetical protein
VEKVEEELYGFDCDSLRNLEIYINKTDIKYSLKPAVFLFNEYFRVHSAFFLQDPERLTLGLQRLLADFLNLYLLLREVFSLVLFLCDILIAFRMSLYLEFSPMTVGLELIGELTEDLKFDNFLLQRYFEVLIFSGLVHLVGDVCQLEAPFGAYPLLSTEITGVDVITLC